MILNDILVVIGLGLLLQFMISLDTNTRTVGYRKDVKLRRLQELDKSKRY